MAGVGASNGGRVSVRVLPDTTQFRRDLRKALARIESTQSVAIAVQADTRGAAAEVLRFLREADAQSTTVKVEVDTSGATRKIDEAISSRDATVNVDADTGLASARLAVLSRPRKVKVFPSVDKSAVAGVATALSALSGARVLTSTFQNVGNALKNLDKSTPKIALLASSFAGIAMAATGALGSVTAIGGGLVQAAGAAAALPGMLAGGAVALVAFGVAMRDAKTELASLAPGFSQLRETISGNFWAGARGPIIDMVSNLMPQLQAGFANVSSALGTFSGNLASSLQKSLSGNVLQGMFDNLTAGINNSLPAATALGNAIATLGSTGSAYLPQFGTWLADIATGFDTWLTKAQQSGQLNGWIDAGIAALQNLGSMVVSVGQILGGLFDAVDAAGFSGLSGLASGLQLVAAAFQDPAFQGGLTTLLQGAAQGLSTIGQMAGPLLGALGGLVPTISGIFGTVGSIIGTAMQGIADVLAQPEFAQGLNDLFTGILAMVQGLLPAMAPLGTAFGTLGTVIGALAAQIGPVLGTALQVLAPVFTSLMTAIEPLIPVLGQGLVTLLTALTPLIQPISDLLMQMSTAILPIIAPLVGLIVAAMNMLLPIIIQLMPVFGQILTSVSSLIPPLLQLITSILPIFAPILSQIGPLFQFIGTVVGAIVPIIGALITILQGVIDFVTGVFTGNWDQAWQGIQQVFSGVWDLILSIITGAFSIISDIFNNILNTVTSIWNGLWDGVGNTLSAAWDGIVNGVQSGIDGVMNFFNDLPGNIMNAISGIGTWLLDSGKSLIQGFIDGITGMMGNIGDAVGGLLDFVGGFFPHSPAKRGPFSGRGYTTWSGKALMEDFAGGMESSIGFVQRAANRGAAAAQEPFADRLNDAAALGSVSMPDVDSAGVSAGFQFNQTNYMPVTDPNVVGDRLAAALQRGIVGVA